MTNLDIQQYFKTNNYVVIKNYLTPDIAGLLYRYCINSVKRADFVSTYDKENYIEGYIGTFGDPQIPNNTSYNCYGDLMMDTLLESSTESLSNYTGLELVPTYSYWRYYQTGDVLERHKDRPSCEYSATLCLGYDISNTDLSYNWPMYVGKDDDPHGLPISLEPGDMIVYKGTDVDHWRDDFKGLAQAQVFMHYNDKNGPYNNLYDNRPILGIPSKFK